MKQTINTKDYAIPYLDSIRNTADDFGIGEWTIRQWVKQNKFPVVMSGRKILINYDVFAAFLNGKGGENRNV